MISLHNHNHNHNLINQTNMSLALSGGGGAMPMAVSTTMPRMKTAPKAPMKGMGANAAALGADLVDANKKKVKAMKKNAAHLPIVSVDLYGESTAVAYQPPAVVNEKKVLKNGKTKVVQTIVKGARPTSVGCLNGGGNVILKGNNEVAYKAVKKLLKGSDGAVQKVMASALVSRADATKSDLEIKRPFNLLGARQCSHLHESVLANYSRTDSSVIIKEQALDGTEARGDDFDRVTFQIKMLKNKGAISLLPEEAVSILVAKAKAEVCRCVVDKKNNDDLDEVENYPVAIALPGWCGDAAIEAAIEACGTREQFIYQRGLCALVASFTSINSNSGKELLPIISENIKKLSKEGKGGAAEKTDEQPLVLMVGLTPEGLELHYVRVGNVQSVKSSPLGSLTTVVSNCIQSVDPLSRLSKELKYLTSNLNDILPNRKPCAIITYGSEAHQQSLKSSFIKNVSNFDLEGIPCVSTDHDAVAIGACAYAADDHGRLGDEFLKAKNVSTCAVGLSYAYFGEDEDSKMEPIVKTVFDFDRKLPTSPYIVELSAAECACVREKKTDDFPLDAVQAFEGGKHILVREAAAKALRIQIVQKTQRDSEWIPVGKNLEPLCIDGEEEGERIGCEFVTLRVSLSSVGLISTGLEGDRQSVVQALKEKRKSTLSYIFWVIAAILFFGGFMFKSWYEDYQFNTDTDKLLAYYKHVSPGSLADGDRNQARYLVWKYRGRSDKLWKRLETKYGVPVPDKWDDEETETEEEEEVVQLDDESSAESSDKESEL